MRGIAVAVGGLLLTGLAACGASPARSAPTDSPEPQTPAVEIQTLVPASSPARGLDPQSRWPSGSRIIRFDPAHPEAEPLVLSEGLDAAGGVWISPDAQHVLFAGRESPGERFGVWRVDADGSRRQRLIQRDQDCGPAARLPDGRIVFSAALPGAPGPLGASAAWALFVAKADGSEAGRITFGADLALDPTVLRDGRVLYATWLPEAAGRPAGGRMALLTVHTDGSGVQLFHGDDAGPRFKLLPRHLADGGIGYRGGTDAAGAGRWRIDLHAPLAPATARQTDAVAHPPGLRVVDVQSLRARATPQRHLSMLKPKLALGRLLCVDARLGEGQGGRRIRIRAWQAASADGAPGTGRVLREWALEPDGSFFADVPADLPLAFELLDAEGAVLRRTVTPIWVRPNESRGCIGCHEPRDTVPPNVRPLAAGRRPMRARGGAEAGS